MLFFGSCKFFCDYFLENTVFFVHLNFYELWSIIVKENFLFWKNYINFVYES